MIIPAALMLTIMTFQTKAQINEEIARNEIKNTKAVEKEAKKERKEEKRNKDPR